MPTTQFIHSVDGSRVTEFRCQKKQVGGSSLTAVGNGRISMNFADEGNFWPLGEAPTIKSRRGGKCALIGMISNSYAVEVLIEITQALDFLREQRNGVSVRESIDHRRAPSIAVPVAGYRRCEVERKGEGGSAVGGRLGRPAASRQPIGGNDTRVSGPIGREISIDRAFAAASERTARMGSCVPGA